MRARRGLASVTMPLIVLSTLVGLATRGEGQSITIRFGVAANPGSLLTNSAEEYARRANDALKGRVEVKVFPSSQLGTDEQTTNSSGRSRAAGSWSSSSSP